MTRITETFSALRQSGKKGFIPFITAGDPNLVTTGKLMVELAHSGASIIELGVPFSDPMADGPVIQRASERALRQGFGLKEIFSMTAEVRAIIDTPIVLFSYFNPLLQYGTKKLVNEARQAGIDAILVTDLIPEESKEFADELRNNSLDMIFLVAPTSTDDRLRLVAECASGFIYAVSRAGVTGTQESLNQAAERLVTRMREFSELPVAVGFGISTANQVKEVWRFADAAVVGSAIVAEIEREGRSPHLVKNIGRFARSLTMD
ncbi:MAG TPA: tryptophan synthase subunit alpha [Pyrinomonadaceae bacterium]|nr:tryptophan synthase subunit alpha [Pyrinomonadaceae bacterium]